MSEQIISEPTGPNCQCGIPSVLRTCKQSTAGNEGRKFFTCSMPNEHKCKYFSWADKTNAPATPQTSQQTAIPPAPKKRKVSIKIPQVSTPLKNTASPAACSSAANFDSKTTMLLTAKMQMLQSSIESNTVMIVKISDLVEKLLQRLQPREETSEEEEVSNEENNEIKNVP